MDLLDSILNAMDAPPANNEQQKTMIKKQRELHCQLVSQHRQVAKHDFRG